MAAIQALPVFIPTIIVARLAEILGAMNVSIAARAR